MKTLSLQLYRPLNIYIALVGIEIWNTTDQFAISSHANQSLEAFLHYRKQRINPYHPNDNSQLITYVLLHVVTSYEIAHNYVFFSF